MTESFAQKKEMSEFHFQNALHQGGDVTTPFIISTDVVVFATELGGAAQFIPVINDQYGLFGWCSDGVEEKVRNDGGKISFGWSIWEWPNTLLTAEFHSVWEDTAGSLFDITPKPQHETRIVFVADASCPQDFDCRRNCAPAPQHPTRRMAPL